MAGYRIRSALKVITDLQNGNIDLAFIEEPVFQYLTNRLQLPTKGVCAIHVDVAFGFAFAKGSHLRDDFNQFLMALGPAKIAEIIAKATQ